MGISEDMLMYLILFAGGFLVGFIAGWTMAKGGSK